MQEQRKGAGALDLCRSASKVQEGVSTYAYPLSMVDKVCAVSVLVEIVPMHPKPFSVIEMFYLKSEAHRATRDGRTRFHRPCRVCQREINRLSVAPRQEYTDAVKLAAGCADCGIKIPHPEIYDFDHLPGHEKVRTVAQSLTAGTMEELIAEIAKCEVVCSNCHRIRTKKRAGERWAESDLLL